MKKYLLIIIVALAFSSCENELNTSPTSNIGADEAFKNEGDFTNAIRGMYYALFDDKDDTGFYYGGELQGFDVMSDNLIISPEGRLSQQFRYEWTYDQNSGFRDYMGSCYAVIRNANFILANIDNLEDGDFKNNAKGEALAIRALAHFDVVRFFAKIPTQSADAGSSLAMPYVTQPDINDLPPRITVNAFYDLLVADLTQAEGLINVSNAGKFQMGKDAVNALLSRVYLYMGNWEGAVTAANNVTEPVGERALFTGIWNDSENAGVIFKLNNTDVSDEGVGTPYNQTAGGIKDEYVPDYEFYLMFDDTDIRKTAYIQSNGSFAGNNYNHVKKWYSSTTTTGLGVVDPKILRAAEVMLTKAEALSQIGGRDAEALAALDAVRSKRYDPFVSGGEVGSALKEAIAKERRLELAFEGMRFTDIKRYGTNLVRSDFGHFADGSGTPATFKTLNASDHRFQVPIPIEETNLNPNMQPNPGYVN